MLTDTLLLALRELRRNLLRALLTTLGIVIGVFAVITIVTLGNGVTASLSNIIAQLGRNIVVLAPGVPTGSVINIGPNRPPRPFTEADVAALRREIGHLRGVSPEAQKSAVAVAGNRNHSMPVTGTDNGYLIVHDAALSLGRAFNDAEIRSGRAACILGETVRQDLFGAGDPVGLRIRVSDVPCEVIGVLAPKGQSTFGVDQDNLMLMPLRTVERRLAGNTNIGAIWLSADTAEDIPRVIDGLHQLMRERRRIGRDMPDDFTANDLATITDTINRVTGLMTLFVAAIAAVSLLVGGIGIMNIMLVSVTERTREIGIRLAIGARERDVLFQFLVEAVMMSAMGGAIGILLGLGVSAVGALAAGLPYMPSLLAVAGAFLFSAAIGIGFGYFPARRAARLDPIEALRHE
jgi:putative ABC transport system permease protein